MNLGQLAHKHDRKWKITTPFGVGYISEYNWEITGATENLREYVAYSGNMYYHLKEFTDKGWIVEELPHNQWDLTNV